MNCEKSWTHEYFNAWMDFSFPYQFWGFPSLHPKAVVLISQKWGRYKLGNSKNFCSYQREYERDHTPDIESNINFINEGVKKTNSNLMEKYFDISTFEQEILTGLIWFKMTKSKDLWMHIFSWSHINNFAWPSGRFSIHVSVFLKEKNLVFQLVLLQLSSTLLFQS